MALIEIKKRFSYYFFAILLILLLAPVCLFAQDFDQLNVELEEQKQILELIKQTGVIAPASLAEFNKFQKELEAKHKSAYAKYLEIKDVLPTLVSIDDVTAVDETLKDVGLPTTKEVHDEYKEALAFAQDEVISRLRIALADRQYNAKKTNKLAPEKDLEKPIAELVQETKANVTKFIGLLNKYEEKLSQKEKEYSAQAKGYAYPDEVGYQEPEVQGNKVAKPVKKTINALKKYIISMELGSLSVIAREKEGTAAYKARLGKLLTQIPDLKVDNEVNKAAIANLNLEVKLNYNAYSQTQKLMFAAKRKVAGHLSSGINLYLGLICRDIFFYYTNGWSDARFAHIPKFARVTISLKELKDNGFSKGQLAEFFERDKKDKENKQLVFKTDFNELVDKSTTLTEAQKETLKDLWYKSYKDEYYRKYREKSLGQNIWDDYIADPRSQASLAGFVVVSELSSWGVGGVLNKMVRISDNFMYSNSAKLVRGLTLYAVPMGVADFVTRTVNDYIDMRTELNSPYANISDKAWKLYIEKLNHARQESILFTTSFGLAMIPVHMITSPRFYDELAKLTGKKGLFAKKLKTRNCARFEGKTSKGFTKIADFLRRWTQSPPPGMLNAFLYYAINPFLFIRTGATFLIADIIKEYSLANMWLIGRSSKLDKNLAELTADLYNEEADWLAKSILIYGKYDLENKTKTLNDFCLIIKPYYIYQSFDSKIDQIAKDSDAIIKEAMKMEEGNSIDYIKSLLLTDDFDEEINILKLRYSTDSKDITNLTNAVLKDLKEDKKNTTDSVFIGKGEIIDYLGHAIKQKEACTTIIDKASESLDFNTMALAIEATGDQATADAIRTFNNTVAGNLKTKSCEDYKFIFGKLYKDLYPAVIAPEFISTNSNHIIDRVDALNKIADALVTEYDKAAFSDCDLKDKLYSIYGNVLAEYKAKKSANENDPMLRISLNTLVSIQTVYEKLNNF